MDLVSKLELVLGPLELAGAVLGRPAAIRVRQAVDELLHERHLRALLLAFGTALTLGVRDDVEQRALPKVKFP